MSVFHITELNVIDLDVLIMSGYDCNAFIKILQVNGHIALPFKRNILGSVIFAVYLLFLALAGLYQLEDGGGRFQASCPGLGTFLDHYAVLEDDLYIGRHKHCVSVCIGTLLENDCSALALLKRFQPVSQRVIVLCILRILVGLEIIFLFWL